jgi:Mg/Co/Ni transporter MgtE
MGDKQVRRIPVVSDDGKLAGIIAMADIALEVEDEREIAEALEEISSGSAFWSKKVVNAQSQAISKAGKSSLNFALCICTGILN